MSFTTEYASGECGGTCLSQTCEFFALRGVGCSTIATFVEADAGCSTPPSSFSICSLVSQR